MALNKVVFPIPFSPTIATLSPFLISKEQCSKTMSSYFTERSVTFKTSYPDSIAGWN